MLIEKIVLIGFICDVNIININLYSFFWVNLINLLIGFFYLFNMWWIKWKGVMKWLVCLEIDKVVRGFVWYGYI